MALLAKGGSPFSWGRAALWATSWGIGAGIGVAAGAWLTVVGEAGAPGVESIDPGSDLFLLPMAVFGAVAVVHLLGQVVAAAVRKDVPANPPRSHLRNCIPVASVSPPAPIPPKLAQVPTARM